MSLYQPDDLEIIDLSDSDESSSGPRRRSRQSSPPPPDANGPGFADPRLMVPLLLLLLAVLVIFLAWRSQGSDDVNATGGSSSELAQAITDAELRAGFDGLTIEEVDDLIVIEGDAANATDVAAIGAVARSVEGTGQIDNQVTVEGGAIDSQFPLGESVLTNGGADLENQLNALGQITFEPGSSDLTGQGVIVLDNVARILEQSPGVRIEIHGHTDSDGDEAQNQVLSQQRSQAVAAALAQRGIDSGRTIAVGFGESSPIAPNITADGRATNRRIEFVVI